MASRAHPHVSIPSGPPPPLSSPWSSYESFDPSPEDPPLNIWADNHHRKPSGSNRSVSDNYPHISLHTPSRPPSRAASAYEQETGRIAFPEPQLYRSSSQRASGRPSPTAAHRSTKSELTVVSTLEDRESRPPSRIGTTISSPEFTPSVLSEELSSTTLESEEGLRRFQAGELAESDELWYRLVPAEARNVLDKKEVQRQSIMFELIQAERNYVADLEVVKEVFVDPLVNTCPMPQRKLKGFINEVFYNLDEIRTYHQQMLAALFARQREQHPLLQSVADIILDTSLLSRPAYESYIKHYPLAIARHQAELQRNTKYQYFISECSRNPRTRKRDLSTFLSRPVTRLPRMMLIMQNALKHTEPDHPDIEALRILIDLMDVLLRCAQPGIDASEKKVQFWTLCESLVYQQGEIIDLDLYDESRSLVHSGNLARRYRGDQWADLHVALLDNYLLLLKPESRTNGGTKNHVISRPIPLDYLRLATFDGPAENRKEKGDDSSSISSLGTPGGLGIFESFRSRYRQVYPFTLYHASAKVARRYTLYAQSIEQRKKWQQALENAIAVRKARQESNMWFAPHVLNDSFFRSAGVLGTGSDMRYTGSITAATTFSLNGKHFVAVGCTSGIYVSLRGENDFRKALSVANTERMAALPEQNKFLVHHEYQLSAYSLDLLARIALGYSSVNFSATQEDVSGPDGYVTFFRVTRIGNRTMVLYVSKGFLQTTFYSLEAIAHPSHQRKGSRTNSIGAPSSRSFRSFGDPLSVPKDAHDFTTLHKSVGICTDKGIHIVDPTNPGASASNPTIIPKFRGAEHNTPMYALKSRCADGKPLGVIRCDDSELLVVYDHVGCYIDRHGIPSRQAGFIRWETKVTAYAHRGEHLLLFSPEFVEIRLVLTGKLVQVIEGDAIRLVHVGALVPDSTLLVAMTNREESGVVVDKLVELVETSEIATPRTTETTQALWDEWDM